EVMAIGRTFEAALLKAIRSLEIGAYGLRLRHLATWSDMQMEEGLRVATDERLFVIAEAFRRGWEVREVRDLSGVDPWFLVKIRAIVRHEAAIRDHRPEGPEDVAEQIRAAKELGLSDRTIAGLRGVTETEVRGARAAAGIWPAFKMVDT